jgi:glycosyltransferase involved in cell wall biosynthesis
MHVLHVIPTIDHRSGGPSLALAGLSGALQRIDGVQVTVAVAETHDHDMVLVERLRSLGVDVRTGAGRAVLRELVERCDVCHIHALWEPVQPCVASLCRRYGKPHIFRPCGMLDRWSLGRRGWKKKLYLALRLRRHLKRCDGVHAVSELEREEIERLEIGPPIIVEPNGLNLEEFAELPVRGVFRERAGLGDGPIALFLGRLHPIKGLEVLVEAFARTGESAWRLVLVGPVEDEAYARRLQASAERLGVADRVVMTGEMRAAERLEALVDADLFVLPSRHENFGVSVIEALAAETPVIVSDRVGVHHEVSDEEVGEVTPADAPALAEAMTRWMGDEAMRREAGARGRAFVLKRYDWATIAERWAGRYRGLLEA